MHFQFDVSAGTPAPVVVEPTTFPAHEITDLLRQLLEAQREQVILLRNNAAAHDPGQRWRAVLSRWQSDFSSLPTACKRVLPQLERTYIALIADLTDRLQDDGDDAISNDFALGEFLDRFGMRLNQLGSILTLVGPLAEIAETSGESK
ncbi:MAG TPA: hypothetical protein VGZ47_18555 [Gemmataceae bacterium]|jgi:hypothetical protein|nr:hypothetical protein [Gemmataceae bacterium]